MAKLKIDDIVEVVHPCSTSENQAGDVGTIKRIEPIYLADFGECIGYLIVPDGMDENLVARWEHESALNLIN